MTTITCLTCGASCTDSVQRAIAWDDNHQEECTA